MSNKLFKGNNLLVFIAAAPLITPVATYAAGPQADGLPLITAIANEPTTLYPVPTGKQKEIMREKNQQRMYFFGGSDNGEIVETNGSFAGNLQCCLARSASDDTIYDPSIDIMLQAAKELNKYIYIRFDQYIGKITTPSVKYRYHVKAGIFLVKAREAQQAEGQTVEVPFELAGQGDMIDGYFDKT